MDNALYDLREMLEDYLTRASDPSRSQPTGLACPVPKPEPVGNELGRLTLTVIQLLRELLERQALRRIDEGQFNDEQIEELGRTLLQISEHVESLKRTFQLDDKNLNLDLVPLGKMLSCR